MNTLDKIRAEIVARFEAANLDCRNAAIARDIAAAELALLDRVDAPSAPAAPEPAKRRDIAALVREALTDDWQTIAQIAEKTGLPPSRLLRVLDRRRANAERDAGGGQWRTRVRAGGLST